MNLIDIGAVWLHLLATVALIGYYAVLAVLVLPALRSLGAKGNTSAILVALERRALPVVGIALLVFVVTGGYLMASSGRYGGMGNFGGTWALLLLVKHLVVVVMLGLGFVIDRLIAQGGDPDMAQGEAAARPLEIAAAVQTVLGAAVLLLTAAVQAA